MVKNAHCIIIGGGIIGCSIAYHLAQLGMADSIILEKEFIASKATGLCPGGIRQQWSTELGCLLSAASVRFFNNLDEELHPEIPLEFVKSGYLFLAYSENVLEIYRKHVILQNSLEIPSRIVSVEDIKALVPDINPAGIVGGAYCHEDGFLEDCYGFTNVVATRAKEMGVKIVYDEATEIILERDHICGIHGKKGEYRCDIVVNAAGCDAPNLATSAGVQLPVTIGKRRLLYTQRIKEHFLEPCVGALEKGWGAKQLQEGNVYMAYIGEGAETLSDYKFTEKSVELGLEILPRLEKTQILRIQDGYYDMSPDGNPILGNVEGIEGYFQAVGFSGHGFMLSPAVGKVMAELITGKKPCINIDPWHLDRFEKNEICAEGLVL